jgi:hypothetical protein
MVSTPNIAGSALLAPDLLDLFERAIRPASAQARTTAAPARPTARQFLPHERKPATDSARGVSLALDDRAPAPKQPRTPDDMSPLEPGEVRVRALRSGFSPREDLPQAAYRQIVRMSLGAAERAANAGAVEILEETEVPNTAAVKVLESQESEIESRNRT